MILADVLTIVLQVAWVFLGPLIESHAPGRVDPEPAWVTLGVGALAVFDIICVLFVFRWMKWAFFGTVLAALGTIVVFVAGGKSFANASTALLMPILLYITLQIGGKNSGWRRLK